MPFFSSSSSYSYSPSSSSFDSDSSSDEEGDFPARLSSKSFTAEQLRLMTTAEVTAVEVEQSLQLQALNAKVNTLRASQALAQDNPP